MSGHRHAERRESQGHKSASVRLSPARSGDTSQSEMLLALQRMVGNRAVAGTIDRGERVIQRYGIYGADGRGTYRPSGAGSRWSLTKSKGAGHFPSQVKENGSFVTATGAANLRYQGSPMLQVSNNLDLAVEANTEAKCFYATRELIDKANKRLKGKIRLVTGDKHLRVAADDRPGRQLLQVFPARLDNQNAVEAKGLNVTTAQRCNEAAEEVSGKKGLQHQVDAEQILADILDHATRSGRTASALKLGWSSELAAKKKAVRNRDSHTIREYAKFVDRMIARFQTLKSSNPQDLEKIIKDWRLNRHATSPDTGDVMVVASVVSSEEEKNKGSVAPYHFGGVVVASGSDYITMENYARGAAGRSDTMSRGDPLYFFRMYGAVKTWHDVQEGKGRYGQAPISVRLGGQPAGTASSSGEGE